MYSLIGFASLLISKAHFLGFSRDLYVSIVLYMFDVQEGGKDWEKLWFSILCMA